MHGIDATAVIAGLLADGHGVLFAATGDSMHPLIASGDMLHVVPMTPDGIRIGDVVLATADRGLTAHRVLERRGDLVVMRGDHAALADAPIDSSRIIGRVVALERNGRRKPVRRLSGVRLVMARLLERIARRLGAAG